MDGSNVGCQIRDLHPFLLASRPSSSSFLQFLSPPLIKPRDPRPSVTKYYHFFPPMLVIKYKPLPGNLMPYVIASIIFSNPLQITLIWSFHATGFCLLLELQRIDYHPPMTLWPPGFDWSMRLSKSYIIILPLSKKQPSGFFLSQMRLTLIVIPPILSSLVTQIKFFHLHRQLQRRLPLILQVHLLLVAPPP